MDKIEQEYLEKYGDVSKDFTVRISDILSNIKSNKIKSRLTEEIRKCLNKKWEKISFVIYLEPKATPRPRHNRASNIFYVKGAANNKKRFEKFLSKLEYEQIVTPTKFTCVSYLPIPKSMNMLDTLLCELGLGYPMKKPDWDNLGKTYSDMIQGKLLSDDAIIVEGISKKFYSTKPRIEITLEYMTEFDIMYNKIKYEKRKE